MRGRQRVQDRPLYVCHKGRPRRTPALRAVGIRTHPGQPEMNQDGERIIMSNNIKQIHVYELFGYTDELKEEILQERPENKCTKEIIK